MQTNDRRISTRKYVRSANSNAKLLENWKKLQEMISQRFSVLLGVQNNMLKVYQNPLIKKLLNWGWGTKRGILKY